MQRRPKRIPDYFVTRKNTILQVLFATLFAYIFINIYRPFGSGEWYNISSAEFIFYSGLLVIAGMLVVLLSRIFLMFLIKKKNPVTIRYYILMIAGEILLMAAMYAFLEKFTMHDPRSFGFLFYLALQNTALILLIPYVISLLFFAWKEKSMSLNNLLNQVRHSSNFISFHDDKGILRISLKLEDLLYLESSDNYVSIKYLHNNQPKSVLIRNTLKNIEKKFENSTLLRCHRSYIVNTKRVSMVKKEGTAMKLLIESPNSEKIPVSRGYQTMVKDFFDQKHK
ncbi:LytTR family transcriptional regulator DNA-binding domain-containing protein [Marinilabilia salmonicolor]|uniref:LytTR family transcriptional regulator DNA-binding domain-containing protein n=1 Tax=Marinilabilia salmonicolor TaxID=989 RepID=UPI00029B350F|nr:LytTR family transcriptional regulator DNA-binding domain-containing protein [Marinilabilia salmonicolor]